MYVVDIEAILISHRLPGGQGLGDARGFGHDRATTLVRVDTGTGEVGWSEVFAPGSVIVSIVGELFRDDVVGMDPFDVRRLAGEPHTDLYHFGGSVFVRSILSGIDVALWDLTGKVTGKPVHQLSGRMPYETLIAYVSTMYSTETDHDITVPIRDVVDEGLSTAKIRIGTGTGSDVERVRTARRLLNDGARLIVDINGNYRLRQAIRTAKAIGELDVTWMEEPVPPRNLLGYHEVKRDVDVPLAVGEAHYGRLESKCLVDDRTIDAAQPSLGRCGGLSGAGRTTDLTSMENVVVRPYVWNSAVGLAVAVQFAASVSDHPHTRHVPDSMLIGSDRSENPLRDKILKSSFDPTGGEADVPQAPGLGVEVDEDAVKRYRADS